MDPNDKNETVRRFLKCAKKMKSRDERRLIDENRKANHDRPRHAPRQRSWNEWDEDQGDEDLFEAMRPAAPTDLSGAKKVGLPELPDLAASPGEPDAATTVGWLVAPRGRQATVLTPDGEIEANIPPHLRAGGALVVGDEVLLEGNKVLGRSARRSVLSRRDPGSAHAEKVIAANVDVGVVVVPAGGRRLKVGLVDRMWVALAKGGIAPVVVINKVDLVDDPDERREIEAALADWSALGVTALAASASDGTGLDELGKQLIGRTAVFVGQSGVGKSSLLNLLDPEGVRDVKEIRDADGRGRHTTSASTLRELGDGTRLIDTPGIRAFGLPDLEPEDVLAAFPDLADLAQGCRFRDCSHTGAEPGCALEVASSMDPDLARRLTRLRSILASLDEAG
ncbi:MAG: ribosome small subunit-dependent GTPase A [Planctomycetota bacterium]|nr:ribosome small subunit-dependent GTPase A [Planctomycetota bacterium]